MGKAKSARATSASRSSSGNSKKYSGPGGVGPMLDAISLPAYLVRPAIGVVYANRAAQALFPETPDFVTEVAYGPQGRSQRTASVQVSAFEIGRLAHRVVVVDPMGFGDRDAQEVPWTRQLKLPPRLARVAALLLTGAPDREIAKRLRITHESARTYSKLVLRRAGVSSRADLARRARKRK